MAIRIGHGRKDRDWGKIISAGAETAIQSIVLGKDGFSSAISALFRIIEELRGGGDVESKLKEIYIEVISATSASCISSVNNLVNLDQITHIINQTVFKFEDYIDKNEVYVVENEFMFPGAAIAVQEAKSIFTLEIGSILDVDSLKNMKNFESEFTTIFSRVRTRKPAYYQDIILALNGPDVSASSLLISWSKYRSHLIARFEDEPLFGEQGPNAVTLSQIYQPLRGMWIENEVDDNDIHNAKGIAGKSSSDVVHHIDMLDSTILNWLNCSDKNDNIRLISGGPGSGKSTFAKFISAKLSSDHNWRVLLVPLQRLRGSGALASRINEFFRSSLMDQFSPDMPPLASYGRDGFQNWLIIFDGLDEFAREGIGSETAAQEFATALSDWRLLTSVLVNAKFMVLGRAPSMQQARRRLGLQGPGTLHVLDMMPIDQVDPHLINSYGQKTIISDPKKLAEHDQRSIFWVRWAVAKNTSTAVPLSMTAEALEDLTKEPLLAYLLILSGYATDNWEQAARNRNYIYEEIFNGIWKREKSKQARISLNDIGKAGFESIMQALGIAAWRGGGRTGDENTFNIIRDVFVKPDILKKAKACGVADLDNVAILFYTRKDEIDGRGYEFLHKSFGEYLTAKGLLECFCRWSDQFLDSNNDFTEQDFLSRWLKVAGQSHITSEILEFLRGEVSLKASLSNAETWMPARRWAVSAIDLMDYVIRYGFAGFESYPNWRLAAKAQSNAELNLFTVLNSCAMIAYPENLFSLHLDIGG